jgi:uncharacterized protein
MWHAGELAVRERAGVVADIGEPEAFLPDVAREFLAAQPWLVIGAADARDRLWASVLYGPPGFVSTPDAATVRVSAQPLPGDPLDEIAGQVGGLALEPATRRRMRLNGFAYPVDGGFEIALEGVYSNCPKYIATRHPEAAAPAPVRHASDGLDRAAAELLAAADTAFVATRAPDGADASHRGGRPGFLRVVDERTVVWPDYQGNKLFNTLGNLVVDPSCGLTVVDPEDGTTLYLSGRARTVWGQRREVELTVEEAIRLDQAAPLRWRLERPARNPPL